MININRKFKKKNYGEKKVAIWKEVLCMIIRLINFEILIN